MTKPTNTQQAEICRIINDHLSKRGLNTPAIRKEFGQQPKNTEGVFLNLVLKA